MTKTKIILMATFAVAIFVAVNCLAAEHKITRNDLPEAVRKTADAQSQGATVRGYTKEKENGQWEYEVQTVANGHSRDITIAPDGHVLEVEEEVKLESLPPAVQQGLQAKAGAGKITKVESLTKGDRLVAYEAQVTTGGKHTEIQVGPDGKPLDHEE